MGHTTRNPDSRPLPNLALIVRASMMVYGVGKVTGQRQTQRVVQFWLSHVVGAAMTATLPDLAHSALAVSWAAFGFAAVG